ncbi:DUF551 domain-containing protein [Rhizobium sp. P007]|uniref:DUF551 domain-containing protein n=1 Tax=Rhizobium sp. P007 TaxID=285908 RepID=UPI0011599032|nr:DUF551 domain-containing protein [Rhizobium sp. P007]CAD7033926.1 hypothetical protein RP007_04181 [Rhizobium sp. P007]
MMGAAENISDLRTLLTIVAEETGALKMSDADDDSVGWTSEGPLPMTFGHVRRAHVALASLEAALSAAEPVNTPFEVASKHIPEARVSLLSRAIRQGLNDYGWKNFGTLPEVLMGYIVQAERADEAAHPKKSRDCGHDGGDLSERRDNIGSTYTRSALSAQVRDVAGWQPIETAPKDGSEILALWKRSQIQSNGYGVVWFEDGSWREFDYECLVSDPTHWMPLPSVPAAPAKQEG